MHGALCRRRKRRPRGQTRPIGIPVLRKVHPVAAHEIRHRDVFRAWRTTEAQCAAGTEISEHVADLRAVIRAVGRLRRPVVEVVHVGLALALLGLKQRPDPRVPGERRITEDILARLRRLDVRGMRVSRENRRGVLAEPLANLRFEQRRRHAWLRKQGPFVRVRPDEHWAVVEASRLIELVLIARQHVAVEDRPESAREARAQRRLKLVS